MAITRREFLKYTAVTGAALYLGIFDLKPIKAYAESRKPDWTYQAYSVGPYCSGGCGIIVGAGAITGETGAYITYVQGNPDSIINAGRICSKCASSAQISTVVKATTLERVPNPARITTPLYRAPGASDWTATTWTAAYSDITTKVLATRSDTWQDAISGPITVNRTTGIAALGGSSLDNEAVYLMTKLFRALGVVYMDTQARN